MRAVIFKNPLSIGDIHSLQDIELPRPIPTGRDLLVEIRAVSVNPVDVKIRQSATPDHEEGRILGWDGAGIVVETGPDVKHFAKGDEVFYAGALTRPGTNAEFHLVDERLVGHKPRSLNWAEAAALPLTTLTAWEMLFERLSVQHAVADKKPSLLIIGGAGGVGSMAIQLARKLTDLTIIATASRPETHQWVETLSAHYVINHARPLVPQIEALPIKAPSFVFSTNETARHMNDIVTLLAPQGHLGLIDDPDSLDAMPLKKKSLSLHWELMFTRSLFGTEDMGRQGEILNELSRLVDMGTIRTTLSEHFGTINATNLKRAHALIESGRAKGKIVLEGFDS